MEQNVNNTNEPQHDAKLPVVGSASKLLVDCTDCDYRHDKAERIEKKGKVWTTYHCPKCGSESTLRVS
jgi:predicted RNA-binding Zn-ribbon protein involved in translation (DUF1610 family)